MKHFEKMSSPQKEKALDDFWYERFKQSGNFNDFEYFIGEKETREKQKKLFLSGEIENPKLDYPRLEEFDFEKVEAELLDLKSEIKEKEPNEVVRQAYVWRINEKIAELRMMRAAKYGNDEKFFKYSKFIYGKPNVEVFEYALSRVKDVVDEKMFSSNQEIKDAATRLNKNLFDALANNETEIDPRNYKIPTLKRLKEEPVLDANQIAERFEAELLKLFGTEGDVILTKDLLLNAKQKGWRVVSSKEKGQKVESILAKLRSGGWDIKISESYTSITVSHEKQSVFIPVDRRLNELDLSGLQKHEIGTHITRREKGERTKLKLLGLGLDRYLKGEEGLATFQEQSVKGASDFSGLNGHFAVSLAVGLDGKKRNFRDVFEILKDYFFINSKKDPQEAKKSATGTAWNICVRTFRGTSCETSGVCFTKDIVYLEGNIAVWEILEENPDEQRRFTIGKYDPSNPRHIWILDQLGIDDKSLKELEDNKSLKELEDNSNNIDS